MLLMSKDNCSIILEPLKRTSFIQQKFIEYLLVLSKGLWVLNRKRNHSKTAKTKEVDFCNHLSQIYGCRYM
jgi:hypothetical protein